jgi:hypothetical protein
LFAGKTEMQAAEVKRKGRGKKRGKRRKWRGKGSTPIAAARYKRAVLARGVPRVPRHRSIIIQARPDDALTYYHVFSA